MAYAYDKIKRTFKSNKGKNKSSDVYSEIDEHHIHTGYSQLQPRMHTDNTISETQNFWWNNESGALKGEGVTASVYEGYNKTTGEKVALKVFKSNLNNDYDRKTREREYAALKTIKHKNIILLKGIETIKHTGQNVIAMELCECSLYAHLLKAQNSNGLEETDFLAVVADVTSGMKYLRNLKYIHRDIKPGNIMRYYEVNGKVTYKLGDFGASRKLEAGQEFQSLYGTDEYLHPDLYEVAKYYRGSKYSSFNENVDLWSLGCTFYHCASGKLPFRPFGGRQAVQTMMKMHAEKPKGALSIHQEYRDSKFITSNHIPEESRLSSSLKSLIEPLLAGLMESNHDEVIPFDIFFAKVDDIMTKSRIPFIIVNQLKSDIIYIPNENTFENFTNILSEQTSIDPNNLLLIWNSTVLSKLHSIDVTTITKENPLLVFELDCSGKLIEKTAYKNLSLKFNHIEKRRGANNINVEYEVKDLKEIAEPLYKAYLHVNNLISIFRHCLNIPDILEEHFQKSSISLDEVIKKLVSDLIIKSNTNKLATIIDKHNGSYADVSKKLDETMSEVNLLNDRLEKEIKEFENQFINFVYNEMKELFNRQNFPDVLSTENGWDSIMYQVFQKLSTLIKELPHLHNNLKGEVERKTILSNRSWVITNITKCNHILAQAAQYSQNLFHALNNYAKYILPFLKKLNEIQQNIQNIQPKVEDLFEECDKIVQECLTHKNCESKEAKSHRFEEVQAFSIRMDNLWAAPRKVNKPNRWVSVDVGADGEHYVETELSCDDDDDSIVPIKEEDPVEDEIERLPGDKTERPPDDEQNCESFKSDETVENLNESIREDIANLLEESKTCQMSCYLEENEKLGEELSKLIDSVKNSIHLESNQQI